MRNIKKPIIKDIKSLTAGHLMLKLDIKSLSAEKGFRLSLKAQKRGDQFNLMIEHIP